MKTLLGILGVALLTFNITAQVGGSQGSLDAQLTKLFGEHKAFSAKSDVQITEADGGESTSLSMDFAMLDGAVRNELDLTKIKSKDLPAEALTQMKSVGMDRLISITHKDTKTATVIYPNLKSFAKMPLPKEQADALDKDWKVEKTLMGKETIDGHPTQKYKVILTDDKGEKKEALVWNATDLKDFPVRIESKEAGKTIRMSFKQVQLAKPDAKLFEPPQGYKEYPGIMELQMAAMQKLMAPPK